MSEENVVETPAAGDAPAAPAVQDVPAKPAPKLLKVYGREFDLSDEKGLLQAQTWSEAMSTLVGKQSTEIGELRKFKSERDAVPKSYDEVTEKASELRDQGNHREADRLLMQFTQEREVAANRKLALERENDRTWDAYFDSRPDVVQLFGKDRIRKVSEASLDILNQENPFRVLDEFWKVKADALSPKSEPAAPAKPRDDIPPASLSGGPARPAPSATPPETKPATVSSLLDAFHAGNKR